MTVPAVSPAKQTTRTVRQQELSTYLGAGRCQTCGQPALKAGRTNDVPRRMDELGLKLLFAVEGDYERKALNILAAHRCHGEWHTVPLTDAATLQWLLYIICKHGGERLWVNLYWIAALITMFYREEIKRLEDEIQSMQHVLDEESDHILWLEECIEKCTCGGAAAA